MKFYERTPELTLKSLVCDICGEDYVNTDINPDGVSKASTIVTLEIGRVVVEFDICADCFQIQLIPAMARLNAKPTYTIRGTHV